MWSRDWDPGMILSSIFHTVQIATDLVKASGSYLLDDWGNNVAISLILPCHLYDLQDVP